MNKKKKRIAKQKKMQEKKEMEEELSTSMTVEDQPSANSSVLSTKDPGKVINTRRRSTENHPKDDSSDDSLFGF